MLWHTPGCDAPTYSRVEVVGRRIAKEEGGVTTNFLYDGDRVYAEYDADWDLVARYTTEGPSYYDPLISMRRGDASSFYAFDQIGTTRKLTNGSETITDSYAFDAFGNLQASSGSTVNPYKYVGALGYYSDTSSGLLHVGARYYAPDVGRFISADPIGYAGGMNQYGYAGNNPVDRIDPSGLIDRQGCIKKANELRTHLKELADHKSGFHCGAVRGILGLFVAGGKCAGFLKNFPGEQRELLEQAERLYREKCTGPKEDPEYRPCPIAWPTRAPGRVLATSPWPYIAAGAVAIVGTILILDDVTCVGVLDDPIAGALIGFAARYATAQ